LTIIDWAVATINQNKSSDPVEIADIPLDDGRTFDLLKAHATTGVFQLESRGMKDLIKRLQPDGFDDIVALVALFRPGPLQSGMVDDFIDRKHGRAAVTYPHPDLEPILCSTYGVILYQEQVMQIAQVLAGYTLGGADMLRRAMGKKKPEEMAKQRTVFVDGAVTRGVERDTAAYIFDLMEKFAGYGFNKSHSAAYALVSYQTAWLKAHYPAAFMAAVLSSDMDNTDKVVAFIDECRQLRLTVVPPAVNASEFRFTVADDRTIIYGLGAVKGIGEAAIELIVQERLDNGEYRDIYDLCRRLDPRRVNRRVLEALIRSGALDCLQVHRAQFMHELPDAIRLADQSLQNSAAGQSDMFGLDIGASESGETIKPAASVVPEWDESRRLAEEKDTLGLYLTGHPVDAYTEELATYTSGRLTKVINETATGRSPNSGWNGQAGTPIVAAGLIVELRSRISQRGSRMRFVTLDDGSARLEARLFGEVAERFGERLRLDSIVVIEGKLVFDTFADALRLNVERVMDLETARGSFARGLGVQLCALDFTSGLLERLHDTMRQYLDGNCRVIVDYRNECARAQVLLGESWRVVPTDDLLMRLRELLGKDRVSLVF
jgi:DNA polymerase-3 subunit alpha